MTGPSSRSWAEQDVDYTHGSVSTGPMVLYIYGAYDALCQGFCYWLIGTESNSTAREAILVGADKTFQAAAGGLHGALTRSINLPWR